MAYVLVIDDEKPIRDLLQEVLVDEGFEVACAETGARGIVSATARMPDLVITDILMPEKEGLETILDLRRMAPALPIIAISGGTQRMPMDVLDTAHRFGALRTFEKPFDTFELVAAVRDLLSPPQTRAAS